MRKLPLCITLCISIGSIAGLVDLAEASSVAGNRNHEETRSMSSREFMQNYAHHLEPKSPSSPSDSVTFGELMENIKNFFSIDSYRGTSGEEEDEANPLTSYRTLDEDEDDQLVKTKYNLEKRRTKRFVLYGSRWPRAKLTYRIRNVPTSMENQTQEVEEIFERAFGAWSNVTVLKFERKTSGKVNILITFVKGKHLHCSRGLFTEKVTAHAFLPGAYMNSSIEIHFDNNHQWTPESLYPLALHEIGHSLGLDDSYRKQSVMHSEQNQLSDLQQDDIVGIQALYSSRKSRSLSQFHRLRAKKMANNELDDYSRQMKSLDDCADYALRNKINLTIWDKDLLKCTAQVTFSEPFYTFYTETGKPLGNYDVFGHDLDTTESVEDMRGWIKNKGCDMILKLDNWPAVNRTSYKCKLYPDNRCCVMLFRTEDTKNFRVPNLVSS